MRPSVVRNRLGDDQQTGYGWTGYVTPDGLIKLRTPAGEVIRIQGLIKGPPGRTPVKGVDYADGKPGDNGVGIATMTYEPHDGGHRLRATLTNGGVYVGPTMRSGRDAVAPTAEEVAKFLPTPKNGDPGRAPTFKEIMDAVEAFMRAHPVPRPKDGDHGKPGDEGPIGPVPLHEVDPPANPHRIRFQIGWTREHSPRWGKWIDLRSLLPKEMPRSGGGGGGGMDTNAVIQLIERTMTTSPLAGYRLADEDSDGVVKYYGYLKNATDKWYILRVDDSVEIAASRYANRSNNSSGAVYEGASGAWANRATLTYGYLSGILDL